MHYLFYVYAFLNPFEYIQEKIPKGPTGINYINIMMLIMTLWWFLGRSGRQRPFLMKTPLNAPLGIFLLWTYFGMALTSLSLPNAPSAFDLLGPFFKQFLQLLNGFLFFFLAANMLDSRRKIRQCLLVLALAAPLIFRVFHAQLSSVSAWHFNNAMRIRGPFVWLGSNELGAFFLYSTIFLGLYAFIQKRLYLKLYFWGNSSLYAYGILYSYSRATQLAFLVAVGLVSALRYRWTLVLIVLAAVTSSMWLPYSVRERWEKTETESGQLEVSAQSRKDFAAIAWDLFLKSPVIGNGVGSFKVLNPRGMDTHNVYMRTLAEMGLIGFAFFMTVWAMVLKLSIRLWRRGACRFDRHFGFCLLIATVAMMIANAFGDRFTHLAMIGHYWLLVGMGARLYAHMEGTEPLADAGEEPDEQQAATDSAADQDQGMAPPQKEAGTGHPGTEKPQLAPHVRPLRPQLGEHFLKPVFRLLQPLLAPQRKPQAAKPLVIVQPHAQPPAPPLHQPTPPKLNLVGHAKVTPEPNIVGRPRK